jgi:hypothetical protein
VNRPAKQTQPISANFCPDPETSGLFPGTSGKMHFGVFSRSFMEFFPLSICKELGVHQVLKNTRRGMDFLFLTRNHSTLEG